MLFSLSGSLIVGSGEAGTGSGTEIAHSISILLGKNWTFIRWNVSYRNGAGGTEEERLTYARVLTGLLSVQWAILSISISDAFISSSLQHWLLPWLSPLCTLKSIGFSPTCINSLWPEKNKHWNVHFLARPFHCICCLCDFSTSHIMFAWFSVSKI